MSDSDVLHILVVCTANACRSPVAERLLERHLSDADVPAQVSSAGTQGGRVAVHGDTVRAADRFDIDLTTHQSRELDATTIASNGTDLVLVMTRSHLRDVVALDPAAWPRTFTLKEFARRGLDTPRSGVDARTWISRVAQGRQASDMMARSELDDLDDPYGLPYDAHLRMVGEVDGRTMQIARLLAES